MLASTLHHIVKSAALQVSSMDEKSVLRSIVRRMIEIIQTLRRALVMFICEIHREFSNAYKLPSRNRLDIRIF